MDAQALPPPREVPQWRWLLASIVLGCIGALISLSAFANGTYSVGPLDLELSIRPASSGVTELEVRPGLASGITPGHTETETHSGYLALRGTVVNVRGESLLPLARGATRDPRTLATYIGDEGRNAARSFGIRAGLAALVGGLAGGGIVALFGSRPRRMLQGGVAGVLLVALLGVIVWQTYDINKLPATTFRPSATATR